MEKPLALCSSEISHLYIIPDGQLYFLPFECLLTQPPSTAKRNYSQLPYVLKSYSTSYSQSATLLCQPTKAQKPKERYAAFAPDYSVVQYENLPTPVQSLYANQEEAKSGSSLFGGTAFTSLAASEAAFKKNARIDHLFKYNFLNTCTKT